jgi:hypothetical protein
MDGEIQQFLDTTSNPVPHLPTIRLEPWVPNQKNQNYLVLQTVFPKKIAQCSHYQALGIRKGLQLFPSPGIPSQQILGRMTQPDYGFPASQWSRRLTGFNPSSLFNTYLHDSHVLTEYQMGHFTAVVHANYIVNKNVSPSTMATNIAITWNQRHVKMAADGNPGLGGLLLTIRKFHSLLKKSTEEVMGQQLLAASRKPPTKPQRKAKVKYVVGIANAQTGKLADGRDFTAALMGDALRKANQSIPNQQERRRQNLLKFFAETKIAFCS